MLDYELDIRFESSPSEKEASGLRKITYRIEKHLQTKVDHEKVNVDGAKDSTGLMVGLTIVGVTLSAVSTIISIISLWKAQQPKYSIFLKNGTKKIKIENLEKEKLIQIFNRLELKNKTKPKSKKIKIIISKNMQ
jgi:LPS sulfotransferase NodH